MELTTILKPERVTTGLSGHSKKRVLEAMAEFTARQVSVIDADTLFNSLVARERLGSTALGDGIAIPHCRLPNITAVIGVLCRLHEPVDFEAPDDRPVDLLFLLAVPEDATDTHLQTLATLAEHFNDPGYRAALRAAPSDQALYNAAITPPAGHRTRTA